MNRLSNSIGEFDRVQKGTPRKTEWAAEIINGIPQGGIIGLLSQVMNVLIHRGAETTTHPPRGPKQDHASFTGPPSLHQKTRTKPFLRKAPATIQAGGKPPKPYRGNDMKAKKSLPAIAATMLLLIMSCTNAADDHLFRGQWEAEQGRYGPALEHLERALEADSKHAESYFTRGIILHDLGEYQQSIRDHSRAIELDPKHWKAYTERARSQHALGDEGAALGDLSMAIELNAAADLAYWLRAEIHLDAGRDRDAVKNLDAAIKLVPNDPRLIELRALAYRGLGEHEKAISDYSDAIALNPSRAINYMSRASAYSDQGRLELALQDYSKAIELEPHRAEYYLFRGELLIRMEEPREARADLERALQLAHDQASMKETVAAFYTIIGINHLSREEHQEAVWAFDRSLELEPGRSGLHFYRGTAYLGLGRDDLAAADFTKSEQLQETPR